MVTTVANGIDMPLFSHLIKTHVDFAKINKPLKIFDIGSRDGNDARYLAHNFPNAETFAFEAHPEEHRIHAHENRNINWINSAVYKHDGFVTFYPKAINSGIHSIRDRGAEFGIGEIQVPCVKMSTFLRNHNIDGCFIVKVDVEGCSLEVLQSFEEYIANVVCFHMESEEQQYFKDQHLQSEVFNFLTANNFEMCTYSITNGSDQHDSVWINKSFV